MKVDMKVSKFDDNPHMLIIIVPRRKGVNISSGGYQRGLTSTMELFFKGVWQLIN